MLKNPKRAFWEALILTAVIFVFGLLLGVAYEESRLTKINEYYVQSETSLMDMVALINLIDLTETSCELLIDSNINFANKIYEEASLLEKYEDSGKITENLRLTHKKYDLLRTFLWINIIKTNEKCKGDFTTVIYLYEYEPEDLAQKATQKVWSRILFDLKQEKGDEIILVPIAVDSDLTSLNSLIEKYNISKFPVVILDQKNVIRDLKSVNDFRSYLN